MIGATEREHAALLHYAKHSLGVASAADAAAGLARAVASALGVDSCIVSAPALAQPIATPGPESVTPPTLGAIVASVLARPGPVARVPIPGDGDPGSRFAREALGARIVVSGTPGVVLAIGPAPFPESAEPVIELAARIHDLAAGRIRGSGEPDPGREQAAREQRLQALSQLASGIAHDFNNQLMSMLGYAEVLIESPRVLDDRARTVGYLRNIVKAANQAAAIVKRLRDFYRKREGSDAIAPVDLNAVAEQALEITRPRWSEEARARGHAIQVERRLGTPRKVSGAEAELRDSVVQLVLHAVEDMPRGGTLTIATREEGDAVVLEVRDTGTGMDRERLSHCLEPFSSGPEDTTRGLGLSTVWGTVRRHEGTIQVESSPGLGTTVRISLPVRDARPAPAAVPAVPLDVLIVDDEEGARLVLRELLAVDGHRVVTVAGAAEALVELRARAFDVAILDRSMPGMSGEQLATAIKAAWPAVHVLLVTGFGDFLDPSPEHARAIDRVLPKPITLAALRGALPVRAAGERRSA